ncbi:MAG: cache domain-containing protein, partial [Phormidium sp.]
MFNITTKANYPIFKQLKKLRSIRYTIPVIIIAPLVVTVSMISWLTFQGGQQQIDQLIYQVSDKSTLAIQSNLESYLASHNAFLSMQLAVIESEKIDPNNFGELEKYFWQQLRNQENQKNSIWKIYVGNKRGDFLGVEINDRHQYISKVRENSKQGLRDFYILDSQGNRSQKKDILEKYDSRSRPWYKKAQKVGKLTWTDIYGTTTSDAKHRLGVTLAVPLFEQKTGIFQGALATDLTLTKISQFLEELSISPTGKAFIIDRDSNLVATSSHEELLLKIDKKLYPVKATESSDPLVRATSIHILDKFKDLDQVDSQKNWTFFFNGQPQFIE